MGANKIGRMLIIGAIPSLVSFVFTFSYLFFIINYLKYYFSIVDMFTWVALALGVVGLVSLHKCSLGITRRILDKIRKKD